MAGNGMSKAGEYLSIQIKRKNLKLRAFTFGFKCDDIRNWRPGGIGIISRVCLLPCLLN
jgi:hypothetical protein